VSTPGKDLDKYDMLVKIAVGSLCHTDGMVVEGDFKTALPCTASHEGSGTVVKVGSAIDEFKVGDRVLCNITYHRCGTCADCNGPESDTQYCQNAQYLGVTRDGSFAEYEVVDGRECCMLPHNLTFQSAAPLACAGTVSNFRVLIFPIWCFLSYGILSKSFISHESFPFPRNTPHKSNN
jgi:propanol-preferring alcohol dehydrogenase